MRVLAVLTAPLRRHQVGPLHEAPTDWTATTAGCALACGSLPPQPHVSASTARTTARQVGGKTLCPVVGCDKRVKHITSHLKGMHKDLEPEVLQRLLPSHGQVTCDFGSDCTFRCTRWRDVHDHIAAEHGGAKVEEMHFRNNKEFEEWRRELQSRGHWFTRARTLKKQGKTLLTMPCCMYVIRAAVPCAVAAWAA